MKTCDKCKCCMVATINYINGNSVIEYHCPVCGKQWGKLEPYKFKKENENGKGCKKS